MKKINQVTITLAFVLSLLLSVGVKTFLHPCIHEDGTMGACGGAANMLFLLGLAMAVIAVVTLIVRNDLGKALLSALLFVGGIVAALTPGTIKPLCMMATMRCQMVMKPGAIVISILICVLSLTGIVLSAIQAAKGKRA